MLSAALAEADELAAEEVQANTRDQGHCETVSSTCQQGVCQLNTPGCTAYTNAEKQEMQQYYSAIFAKILLSGKCTPSTREGDATCSKYGYCDLVDANGERSAACEPMTQAEHEQLLTKIQQMGDSDPSVLFPAPPTLASTSTPVLGARVGTSAGAGVKAKRDVSSASGGYDKAEAFEQFVNAEAAKIANLAVEQSTHNQGMCDGDTETCHAGFCQLSAPHCRPIDADTKAALREYWTELIAKVLTTGKCQSASREGCTADGYCDLMTREGERNAACAELSMTERQKLIESLEYHEVNSSTPGVEQTNGPKPEHPTVIEPEQTNGSKPEHPTVIEPQSGAKAKRDLSRGRGGQLDHGAEEDSGRGERSTTSGTSDSTPEYTTKTFTPEETDLPAVTVTQEELREYMELCQQLSHDHEALESVANAAGVSDEAEIETLADRFAVLAQDKHAAKMALMHAKQAQMLAESKLSTQELPREEQGNKQ